MVLEESVGIGLNKPILRLSGPQRCRVIRPCGMTGIVTAISSFASAARRAPRHNYPDIFFLQ
jgi:hypothetical protein